MATVIKESNSGWTVSQEDTAVQWQTLDAWRSGQALLLQVDDEPDASVAGASAIAINFPAFTDGRGLSLAVLLRTRFGYDGELRATGATHEDILHYMVRCGFDAVELPDERDAEAALAMLSPYSHHYQGSVRNPLPALRRVNRAA